MATPIKYQMPAAPTMQIPFGSTLSSTGLGGPGAAETHSPYGGFGNYMGGDTGAYGSVLNRNTALQPLGQFSGYQPGSVLSPAAAVAATGAIKGAPQSQMPVWWNAPNPLANTKTGFYKPASQSNVNQYLQNLMAGWYVNPNTGQAASPAQAMGKAGSSLADYRAHRGILDPVSAQSAIQQFQQGLSGGSIVPGSTPGTYVDPNWATSGGYYSMQPGGSAPAGPQTTNFFNPQYSQPGQMTTQQGLTAKPTDAVFNPGLAYTAQGAPIYATMGPQGATYADPSQNPTPKPPLDSQVNLSQMLPGASWDTLSAARKFVSPTGGHFDAQGNWRSESGSDVASDQAALLQYLKSLPGKP